MTKSVKLIASALVPAVIAGTCLASPALAASFSFLGGSTAADPDPATVEATDAPVVIEDDPTQAIADIAVDMPAAGDETEPDAAAQLLTSLSDGTITFAGVTAQLPEGWVVDSVQEGESLLVTNASGSVAVGVYDFTMIDLSELGDTDPQEFFDYVVTTSVEEYADAEIELLGSGDLGNGLFGYGYGVTAPTGDDVYVMVQVYVPMGDGFTFLQMGYSTNDATEDEIDELGLILETLGAAEEGAEPNAAPTADGKTVSSGLSFVLPEGLEYLGDDTWMSTAGGELLMIATIADVANGPVELTDDDLNSLLEMLGEEFGMSCMGYGAIPANSGLTVYGADYSMEDEGETIYITLGLVQLSDGTVSCLLAMGDAATAEAYGEEMFQTFASIELA